jgi:hypothetical protein
MSEKRKERQREQKKRRRQADGMARRQAREVREGVREAEAVESYPRLSIADMVANWIAIVLDGDLRGRSMKTRTSNLFTPLTCHYYCAFG